MNTAQINKSNNIKRIPTELNFYYNTNKRISRLKKQGNTSRLLIMFLILWNIVITLQFIPQKTIIPQFTEEQNKQIMLEELIPPYNLEPIEE